MWRGSDDGKIAGVFVRATYRKEQKERQMNFLVIMLRMIHIVAGVFWLGASLVTTFFILPTSAATAEPGQRFLAYLIRSTRFTQLLAAAAGLTGLAGVALYWIDSEGLTSPWIHSAAGWGFGIGGLFGLVGFVLGTQAGLVVRRIGDILAAVRGQRTQAQALDLDAAQRRLYGLGAARDVFLLIALICMATARYWRF